VPPCVCPHNFINSLLIIWSSYYSPHFNPLVLPSSRNFILISFSRLNTYIPTFLLVFNFRHSITFSFSPYFHSTVYSFLIFFRWSCFSTSHLPTTILSTLLDVSSHFTCHSVPWQEILKPLQRKGYPNCQPSRRRGWNEIYIEEATEIPSHPSTLYRHSKLFGVNSDTCYRAWHVDKRERIQNSMWPFRDAIHIPI
jgi:hypothetical protein